MKSLHKLLAAASAAFFIAGSAFAQNPGTVTANAFLIGKGAGTTGFVSLLCGSAQLAVGQSAAAPICQTITGDVTISAAGVTAIGADKVTNAMFRNAVGISIVGRATNTSGDVGDINAVAGSGGVFRESGSVIGFGTIATAGIANSAVTSAKLNADVYSTAHSWSGQQTFVAPILGTPASGNGSNLTALNATQLTTGTIPTARLASTGVPAQIGAVATVKKQVFTASGTYTPCTGLLYSAVDAVGGGGGGGGVTSSGTTQVLMGGGGGAGGYSRSLITAATIGASQIVTIGAAGAGGAAGSNDGTAGTATSLGSLVVANGGAGGTFALTATSRGIGGAGGTVGTGDIANGGTPGLSGAYGIGGSYLGTPAGGASFFGGPGTNNMTAAGGRVHGSAATGYGSGGGGGAVGQIIETASGGNGKAGVIYITEFCSQ